MSLLWRCEIGLDLQPKGFEFESGYQDEAMTTATDLVALQRVRQYSLRLFSETDSTTRRTTTDATFTTHLGLYK